MKKIFIAIFAFIIFSGAQGFAQQSLPVVVNGDQVEYFEDEKKVVGEGNVVINYKDMKLTCDKATVYTQTKDAVLEGNVKLVTGNDTFEGEKLFYNFDTKVGKVDNVKGTISPWHCGAEELDKEAGDKYVVKKGYITTCDAEHPHYKIQAKTLEIYPDNKVVAKNAILYIGKIPIFWFPTYSHSFKNDRTPKFSVVPGRDKDWGYYILTNWHYTLNENNKADIKLDYRTLRGFGYGVDYYYNTQKFGKGVLRLYGIEDQRKNFAEEVRNRSYRWRIQLRHRWDIDEKTVAMLEVHKYRDDQVIKDFFYRQEYEKEPHPESYFSLIRSEPYYTVSLLTKKRLNDFDTVTERLPEAKFDLKEIRLGETAFYLKNEITYANLQNRYGDSDSKEHAQRLDMDNRLSYAAKFFDWLSVVPYAGTRETYYSRNIWGDRDLLRTIFYTGVDASTRFYKTYDIENKFLGVEINKLRHIVIPTASYIYMHDPTIEPYNLYSFDDIDRMQLQNIIRVGLENKLQTKWRKPGGKEDEFETIDLADVYVYTDYQFRGDGRGKFLNIYTDSEFRLARWLYLEHDSRFNTRTGHFDISRFDLVAQKEEDWRFALGHIYERGESCQVTAEAQFKVTPKWKIRAYERYEFDTKELVEQEYGIVRDLHCWLAELNYNISKNNDHTIWVVFRLKAFPDVPISLKTGYHGPKPGVVEGE